MREYQISRRDILKLIGISTADLLLATCLGPSEPSGSTSIKTPEIITKFEPTPTVVPPDIDLAAAEQKFGINPVSEGGAGIVVTSTEGLKTIKIDKIPIELVRNESGVDIAKSLEQIGKTIDAKKSSVLDGFDQQEMTSAMQNFPEGQKLVRLVVARYELGTNSQGIRVADYVYGQGTDQSGQWHTYALRRGVVGEDNGPVSSVRWIDGEPVGAAQDASADGFKLQSWNWQTRQWETFPSQGKQQGTATPVLEVTKTPKPEATWTSTPVPIRITATAALPINEVTPEYLGVKLGKDEQGVVNTAVIDGRNYGAEFIEVPNSPNILFAVHPDNMTALHGRPVLKSPELGQNLVDAYATSIAMAQLRSRGVLSYTVQQLEAGAKTVKDYWKTGKPITDAKYQDLAGNWHLLNNQPLVIRVEPYTINQAGWRGADDVFTTGIDVDVVDGKEVVIMTLYLNDLSGKLKPLFGPTNIGGTTITTFTDREVDLLIEGDGLAQDLTWSFQFLGGAKPREIAGKDEPLYFGLAHTQALMHLLDPGRLQMRSEMVNSPYAENFRKAYLDGDAVTAKYWLTGGSNEYSYKRISLRYSDQMIWTLN